jgi:hypothetical protein
MNGRREVFVLGQDRIQKSCQARFCFTRPQINIGISIRLTAQKAEKHLIVNAIASVKYVFLTSCYFIRPLPYPPFLGLDARPTAGGQRDFRFGFGWDIYAFFMIFPIGSCR